MATYQVVPYLISVHPRATRGAEVRPIEDLDGSGTSLNDLISFTLQGAVGRGPYYLRNNNDKSFRVADVTRNSKSIYFTVTQGSRGIESRMNDNNEVVFERKPNHIEDVDFRNLMIFPSHGSHALLLTERIGNFGVSTFLSKIIVDTLRQNFHEVTTEIKPLVTTADLSNANILLRGVEFKFPNQSDSSARRMDLSHPDGKISIKYKFGAASRLSNYTDGSGRRLDPSKVFGVVDTSLVSGGLAVSGERLKELGVKADLQVTLPSGNHRSFTLGIQEGPALVYNLEPAEQAGSGETDAARYKPSDDDFLRVAKESVSDVSGNFGITESSAGYCAVPSSPDPIVVPSSWEVVWNVPDHIAPDSA